MGEAFKLSLESSLVNPETTPDTPLARSDIRTEQEIREGMPKIINESLIDLFEQKIKPIGANSLKKIAQKRYYT